MFAGHYAVAYAAPKTAVALPLWVWFAAVQWLDIVFMSLAILRVEKLRLVEGFTASNDLDLYYMPFSHGLVGAVVLSLLFAALVALVFPAGRSPVAMAVVALASFSHWVLDLIMHTPDLPLIGDDSTKVGLGLWDHYAIGLAFEVALLVLAVWLYTRAVTLTERGALLVWGLGGLILVIHLYSQLAPAPPSEKAFAATGLLAYVLLAAAAAWVERRAVARPPA